MGATKSYPCKRPGCTFVAKSKHELGGHGRGHAYESKPSEWGEPFASSAVQAHQSQGKAKVTDDGLKVEFIPKSQALLSGLRGVPVDSTVDQLTRAATQAGPEAYARVVLPSLKPSSMSAMRRHLRARGVRCRMSPSENTVVVWMEPKRA